MWLIVIEVGKSCCSSVNVKAVMGHRQRGIETEICLSLVKSQRSGKCSTISSRELFKGGHLSFEDNKLIIASETELNLVHNSNLYSFDPVLCSPQLDHSLGEGQSSFNFVIQLTQKPAPNSTSNDYASFYTLFLKSAYLNSSSLLLLLSLLPSTHFTCESWRCSSQLKRKV